MAADLDLAAVRTFLAETWPDAEGLPRLVMSAVVQLQQIQQLPAHWRVCAVQAETDAEKETWILCADQLQEILNP